MSKKLKINYLDELEEKLRAPRRKKSRMKVSGASVKKIVDIIRIKSSK